MVLLIQKSQWLNNKRLSTILLACYLIIFILCLRTYIIWQSVNLVLGIIILPLVTTINISRKGSKKFAVVSIMVALMAFIAPVKTFVFIAIVFAVFFLIEQGWGRINAMPLPLLVCLFMSPFSQFAVGVFSFPIRVVLTEWAGKILSGFGETIKTAGNVIEVDGQEFSVDPACMGLNMALTSVMLGLVLISLFQKNFGRTIKFGHVLMVLLIVVLLNVVSNLLRIILLVKFLILPDNAMHDVVGLLCLVVYVFLPAMFLAKYVVKRFGKQDAVVNSLQTSTPSLFLNACC